MRKVPQRRMGDEGRQDEQTARLAGREHAEIAQQGPDRIIAGLPPSRPLGLKDENRRHEGEHQAVDEERKPIAPKARVKPISKAAMSAPAIDPIRR
jgi:hypothetical protein